MASLEQYAQWLVNNQDKKGTPDFETVANAYRSLRSPIEPPAAPVSTQPAGFSLKDIGTAFGQGAVGSAEAITNVAGAGNVASQYLGGLGEILGKQYSPERQAEMQRQQERMKKAEQSGSTWEEIKAGAQNIYEAPLQSVAQGLGSFVPYVPAIFAGPVAAALGLSGRAVAAANVVAKTYAPVVGTAQGAGSVKGAIYDAVYKAEKESGFSEEEAKQKADAAQDYAGKNLDQIALGAGLGYVASKGGVEKFLTREGREKLGEKALLPRVGGAMLEESLTEGAQGGQERLAQNIALQRTGRDVPTFQGVAGQAAQEAIIGGLTAGPVAAISGGKSKEEIEQERLQKERDAFEEQRKAFIAQQEKTEEQLQVPKTLALPAPSREIKPVRDEEALANPLGNITQEELGPEVTGYVNKYRQENNLPPLQSYSIEDVKDAMTQVNPEGEKGALSSILAAKTGFSGEETYTPQDVVNAAIEKNIAYETVGFQDFLQRTTGDRDLNTMTPPQLYSAFKALSDMKRDSTGEQLVLPEGSNASRFTQDQYKQGQTFVTQQLATGEPLIASPTREALKGVTGLKTDRDVHTLLQTLIKNEDLNVAKVGDDYQITPTTPTKDARAPLPKGFSIQEGTFAEGERPAGYEITPEGRGKPLTTVDLEEEVAPKIERLTGLRQQEAAKMLADVNKYSGVVKAGQSTLDGMEARGLSGTEAFAKEKANQARREDILGRRIKTLMDRIEEMSAPLKSKPVGTKQITAKKHTLYKDGKALGTFPSRIDAEASMLSQLSDTELDTLASDTRFGGITDRAVQEKERRQAPAGMRVKGTEAGLEKAGVAVRATPEMLELEKTLVAALSKFGLKDVALKVVRAIEQNAEGSYAEKLVKIAFDAANPIRTMRHEAIHALKELGFFTKDQWRVLENKAKTEWIQTYLAGKSAVYDGKQMSRLDAYKKMGLSDSDIIEEAIADAFADFDVNKAPPGLMMALLNKLRNFFSAIRQALTGAGFESAEDIFGKVETGKLESQIDKADKAGESIDKKKEKLSLYGEGVPLSTRGIMDRQTVIAQQELGLNTEAVRNRFNNVREIASALNRHTKVNFGVMDKNNLTSQNSTEIAKAIADEIAYQLRSTSKTGTGLGWYSNNYPKAVRRLAKRFPELRNNEHAQSVFSALVAVTSNGEKVTKNIDNAIKLYAKLRDGKSMVAMGNRRATALKNNLVAIQDLLEKHGTDFKRVLLEEITVKEMNARLREMGEETDSSYLADTVVPAAAVYFGPKLGAFYANLSGSEGYLTMDLWWTRSINRMRGLLMPKATEASIDKFRDMMDQPSATRDEVIAATIPLRNKYEEYGWMTELEHLAKSKEPAKKVKKDAWFAKAKREAGDAYDQLLFEHNLEKMANTIYKNEFEMLEETPFTATDRKFMYDAARKAQQLLRNEDINLTLADIQASLWYYEKRLYEKLSGRKADDIGYEEAIIAQADQGGGRARPSVVFSEQPDGGDGPEGKVSVSGQLRERSESKAKGPIDENVPSGEPTVRSSDRGRGRRNAAGGEKFSLREDIRSYRGGNEASPETHTRKSIGDGGSVRVLGVKPIAQYSPTESFKEIVNGYGHQSPVFYEISGKNADVYEQAIQESKDSSPYGASVYVYPVEDYAKMRLFMTEDGKSGVALKDDDIVSVFSGPPHKGSVNSSIQLAVQEGGRRLDAFDTVLPDLYNANGFQIVGRMKWNEDYKPDNWDKKTFSEFNNGEPDVVYMAYNPDDNRTVSENRGEYFDDPDELGQAQKDAVNTYFNEGTGYGTARQIENAGKLQAQGKGLPQQRGVRRSLRLLDDETRAKYPNLEKPVKGLPAVAKVDGVDVTFGPYMAAREAAVLHAEKSGIPYRQQASYHKLDPEFSKMLASSYARMLDDPNDPQVKAAYKAWADETIAQYEAMLKTGIKVEFFPDAIDTYGNPRNSILDVLNNNHLYVFPADGGFGKGGITDEQIKKNPALALTDIIISGRKARVVEVFRATHDFFGHIKEGFGFRAEGEENAFQSHVRMYSPLAARAMTAGTRGQNSEVNFGPNADFNKTASGKDTKYADQKIGLMPEWASTMNIEPDIKSESLSEKPTKGIVLGTKQPQSQSFTGTHYGKIKTDKLDSSKYGTGLQGSEARRLSGYKDNRIKKRVYFYIPKYNGQMPLPESGVGNHVYTQTFDNIASPEVLSKLYAEARGDANTMESLVVDAGYDGYAAPSMGMMVILNHDVPVNYEGTKAEFDAKKTKFSLRAPETKSFKQWFGDSKVVDKNGKPLVVYHGTSEDFSEFIIGKKANRTGNPDGFYFTPSAEEASDYAGKKDGGNVMPVYVSIKNPFLNKSRVNASMLYQFEKELRKENPTLDDSWIKEKTQIFKDRAARENRWFTEIFPNISFPTEAMTRVLEAGGYDGFKDGSHWIAIKPTQIKSATGNIGTYNAAKPDIRYSLRTVGEPATKENVLASMKMEQEKQPYMNCQLCVQMATGVPKLLDLPRVKKAQVGDVYTFNERKDMASHYAIDIGDGNIAEVEGWGEEVRTVPLQEVVDEYGEPDSILRPPSTAYTGKVAKTKYSLRDVKSEIESLPNGSKIFTAIKRTTTTREEEGFVERITSAVSPDSFSRFRAQALDRYNQLSVHEKNLAKDMGGIERLADSNAHAAALMSDLHAGVTAQVLGVDDGVGGVPVYDKGYTTVSNLNGTVKGPMDIFKQLAAYGDPTIYQAYQFWSAAKRGKRLLAEGKEENITQQDLAFAKELEKKYPEFVSIQKEWIKFNNGLVKYMVDTGVISEEMSKEWTKYSDYLPFYRQLDGEKTAGPNIFQSISGVKPPKKLKGSEAPLADFLETVVRNTHAAVQAGMKNVAAQRAGELAVQVGIGEKLDHLATGADIITALEKGKQVAYRVGDPLFVDAVKSLNIPELPFMSFLTAPANLLRNLVTKDPGFMLANLMRDSISAYVTSGANIKPMIDTVQNFTKAAMNNSPEFEVLKKAGVVGGYDYSKGVQASTESFAKRLRKRAGVQTKTEKALSPVTGIWDFLEKGTEASDAATRIAVYKATLKATGNEAEALLRSLEIMNFNRKGSSALVRIVTAGVPFLNARMQGLDVLYRAGIRPFIKGSNPTEYEKAVQRTFFVRGAMLMGISLMYAMAVKDDPEYEAQEEETKDNNWLITDLGIRIPTPFEVGFIFKTVPERIYRWAFSGSDTGEEFADSMKRGLVSTFAFNPVPQTLLPVAEAITNYSTFTMRPIVGQNLQSIDPRYQVGPSTSVMAEKLGEQLGVSPMKIDHLYKGYTGTMGMYLVDVMDTMFDLFSDNPRPAKRFEQMPVLKRFLVDPDARGNVTAYYAFKHSVDEAVRTVNFLSKRLDEDAFDYEEKKMGLLGFKQYVSGLDKQMTSLQDEATMIRSSGMPPKEKRDALLEIARIQNEIVSDIREIKKMAKEK